MIREIIITSDFDLRSEWTKLGLSGRIRQLKCIARIYDSKPSAVSSGRESGTGISTIMKRAFETRSKAFFYLTSADTALILKLGADERYNLTSFDILDRDLFNRRVEMAEVVAVLTKQNGTTNLPISFQTYFPELELEHMCGPVIDHIRIKHAFTEFAKLVQRGISKHSHPTYFQRISFDRGVCAVGIAECVKRI